MKPHPLLDQLHDIAGVDPISSWPLAFGWYVVVGVGALSICIIIGYAMYRLSFRRSWKYDTLQKLDMLEKNLTDATLKETVIALSEYLRRITLQNFSRKECAALMGEAWLVWLAQNDPKKFDWEKKGTALHKLAYAPTSAGTTTEQIKELIDAARGWVQ